MQSSSIEPLKILSKLDAACRHVIDSAVPEVPIKTDVWSGVAFRIFKNNLIIQNTYVSEILNVNMQNNLSKMPGAKTWLLGLISLRGQPLPVIDLKQYLFGQATDIKENSRLLVINENNHISGLLLEEVFGLKQFPNKNHHIKENEDFPAELLPFVDQKFEVDGKSYGNFSIPQLTNNEDFANAAR